MGGLNYTQTSGGLVLAEYGVDGAAVARALRDYDPDLRLLPGIDRDRECELWRVYRYAGSERPAELVCFWQDEHGVPLPLSMRLLDKVKSLDRNSRTQAPSLDELEEQRRRRRERDDELDREAIYDNNKNLGKTVLPPRRFGAGA